MELNKEIEIIQKIKDTYPEYSKVFFRIRNNRDTLFIFLNNKPNIENITRIEINTNNCYIVTYIENYQKSIKTSLEQIIADMIDTNKQESEVELETESETEFLMRKLHELRASYKEYRHYEGKARRAGISIKELFGDE